MRNQKGFTEKKKKMILNGKTKELKIEGKNWRCLHSSISKPRKNPLNEWVGNLIFK